VKTIIIGLGNPILSDDSVGIKVARILQERLKDGIDIIEAYAGGMRLMDAMVGYDRAFIVDAMVTEDSMPGAIRSLCLSDLISTRNMLCAHDMNLATAIEMGKMLGLHLPSEIRIWGIEAADVETFSEELTEDVAKAVPAVIEKIMYELSMSNMLDEVKA
jgi:hydrogenase maturation protease